MAVGSAVVLWRARMAMLLVAGGRGARVLEAGPGRASTHLSVVGGGFGHCEDVVVGTIEKVLGLVR